MMKNQLKTMLAVAAGVLMSTTATATDPTLYGYQYNMLATGIPTGLYQTPITGTSADFLWQDSYAYNSGGGTTGNIMLAGWERDGKLCGFESQYPMPSDSYYKYVERDLMTGEVTREMDVNLNDGWTNFFLNAAYCPDDDRIYGYGFNAGRTAFAFKSAPADNPNQAVIIHEVGTSYPGSICYNHETGAFYGVLNQKNDYDGSYDNTFVSIDVNTGLSTSLYTIQTSVTSDYKCIGALVWVPARQAYLWNFYTTPDNYDACSQLVEINPDKQTASAIRSFDQTYNFFYFITRDNDPVAVAGAPAPVDGFNADVRSGSADLSFTLPSKMADGGAISGTVNYTIYVDGQSANSGSGTPGSEVNYTVSLSDGTHFVRVVPTVGGIQGLAEIHVIYIGEDSPRAPENVTLTETDLTWDAVTQGIAGNTLSGVTYRVSVNGRIMAEIPETHLDMTDIILQDDELTNYTAEVYAVCNGRLSKAGVSNSVIAGEAWSVPFTVLPTPQQYSLMMQDDPDGDNVRWSCDMDENTGLYMLTSGFSKYGESDDWIFLPKFKADADKVYTLDFNVFLADTELGGGKVEVWIGDGPTKADMKRVLVPGVLMLTDSGDLEFTADFIPDGELAGKDLYIGIGVTSDAGVLSPLRFQNIEVAQSAVTLAGPAAVSNLSAKASESDKSKIDVTFDLPSKTIAGDALSADATVTASVKVQRPYATAVQVSGKPGETVTATLSAGAGDYLISVTPSANGLTGISSNCSTGLDVAIPGLVTNLRVAYDDTNCKMRLDWEAPTTDANGNPMEDDNLNYNVWVYSADAGGYELAVNVPYPLTYAVVAMEDNYTLQNLNVGVSAVNSMGESPDLARVSCQVGTPLSLPISDDFNGDEFKFGPITYYQLAPYDKAPIQWGPTSASAFQLEGGMIDDMGDVLCGVPSAVGAQSRIDLPKVSTLGRNKLSLQLNIWTGENAASTVIKGSYPGSDVLTWESNTYYPMLEKEIQSVPAGNGYELVTIPFTDEFLNKPWINAIIESTYPSLSSRFILAGYAFGDLTGLNTVETIFGTIVGRTSMVTITGYDGATARVFTLDGKLAASTTISGGCADIPVAPGMYVVRVADRTAKVIVK